MRARTDSSLSLGASPDSAPRLERGLKVHEAGEGEAPGPLDQNIPILHAALRMVVVVITLNYGTELFCRVRVRVRIRVRTGTFVAL